MTLNRFKHAQPSRSMHVVRSPAARNSRARRARGLLAAGLAALLLTACQAQKPSVAGGGVASASAAVKPGEARAYAEPALIGKVIDQFTKQPLKDAYVYGYYATSGGTLAGGSVPQESVRGFAAVTDGDGVFKLEAWDSGGRKISGVSWGTFPVLTVWKPGYAPEFLALNSITEWRPRERGDLAVWQAKVARKEDPLAGYVPPVADTSQPNTLDWRARGFQLKPISMDENGQPIADKAFVELQRYNAISDVLRGMRFVGECGWEPYAKVLLAQHDELKRWVAAVVPIEHRDSDGYGLSSWGHPDPMIRGYAGRSFVDRLKIQHQNDLSNWKCANPSNVFAK
jgi:hypothetical protein